MRPSVQDAKLSAGINRLEVFSHQESPLYNATSVPAAGTISASVPTNRLEHLRSAVKSAIVDLASIQSDITEQNRLQYLQNIMWAPYNRKLILYMRSRTKQWKYDDKSENTRMILHSIQTQIHC
jgi:hypothetical protein